MPIFIPHTFELQLIFEQHGLNCSFPSMCRYFSINVQSTLHIPRFHIHNSTSYGSKTVPHKLKTPWIRGQTVRTALCILYKEPEHCGIWYPKEVLEPIFCGHERQLQLSFREVKSYMGIFYCTGIQSPNTSTVQESTVFTFFTERGLLIKLKISFIKEEGCSELKSMH